MGNNNTNNTMIENVYDEETERRVGEAIQNPRIDEIEDEENTRRGAYWGQSPRTDEIEDEEIARRGAYGGQSPRIGILDEIEEEELATGGRAGGEAPALMDTIHINSSIEDRIRILRAEMITRGLETEESLKRLRSYEKRRNDYRCLMEELARYYDRQMALGLPIEEQVLKTGVYLQYIILL